MRKRTRVAVVVAALLFGLAAPTLAGAAGNDRFVLAGTVSGGVTIAERATQIARFILTGKPPSTRPTSQP